MSCDRGQHAGLSHETLAQVVEGGVDPRPGWVSHVFGLGIGAFAQTNMAAKRDDSIQIGLSSVQIGLDGDSQVSGDWLDSLVHRDNRLGEGRLLHVDGDGGTDVQSPLGEVGE